MATNHACFERAQKYIPGGVNSPVRAFGQVGGDPFFVARAEGAYMWDVEGKRYTDFVGSWGPMISGHAHPDVVAAVTDAATHGLSFGAPCPDEAELAAEIIKLVPSIELVRMVNSGTEATMSAIRLARGFTGRDLIVKFSGCYHGHADSFLVKAGSGVATLGLPNSPGVPACLADLTLTCEFNDLEALSEIMRVHGDRIASIIVEPVAGNMNCVPPLPGYLQGMRKLCDDHGSVLIFDEVMTGFRVALGGAQSVYGVKPDLTTFGKVIGAGMPVGAYGGRRDIMSMIAPLGPVYQGGTLSGNPLAMAAGLANLKLIQADGFYDRLTAKTKTFCSGMQAAADAAGVPFATVEVGPMFGLYFAEQVAKNYTESAKSDIDAFKRFFHASLKRGVFFAPSAYEAGFMSIAHTDEIIAESLAACTEAMAEVGRR